MDIKTALTFTCVNIKKLANLPDKLLGYGDSFSLIFEKLIEIIENIVILILENKKTPTRSMKW